MKISVRTWAKNKNSVSVDYGPLSFALKIDERWEKYGKSSPLQEWEVFAATSWNYGLILDARDPARSFRMIRRTGPLAAQPFTPQSVPIALQGKARRIADWQMDTRTGIVGILPQSPVGSSGPIEEITLIPMGAARLRISSFPTIAASASVRK